MIATVIVYLCSIICSVSAASGSVSSAQQCPLNVSHKIEKIVTTLPTTCAVMRPYHHHRVLVIKMRKLIVLGIDVNLLPPFHANILSYDSLMEIP